ncbi:hypothetical protein EZS27_007599 [termite gut metagenome]|uniref:Uncharacterized protein n=1 Tax=termite gut metagenome TaxID=433724 RepID=A0A5J4SFX8_9ZZZZ
MRKKRTTGYLCKNNNLKRLLYGYKNRTYYLIKDK